MAATCWQYILSMLDLRADVSAWWEYASRSFHWPSPRLPLYPALSSQLKTKGCGQGGPESGPRKVAVICRRV